MQATIECNFKENVWSKFNKMAENLILGLISARCAQSFFQNSGFDSH